MQHECIIGIYNNYEDTDLFTFSELVNKNTSDWKIYKMEFLWLSPPYFLQDYFDKRKNTELTRFNYCPECGKKIDWAELKKKASKYDASEVD